jgi:DNA-binding NarL/FixJ family response regulator
MNPSETSGAVPLRGAHRHPLINRNFSLLWSGQTISVLGDFIFNTTLVVWVAVVLTRGQAWTPLAVIRALTPHTQVVALTSTTDDARDIAALRAGAISYVRKGSDPKTLLAALRAAARGQAVLDPAIASAVLQELTAQKKTGSALSEREQEVLRQIALGRTNRQIAEKLIVGEETIKTHVGNILAKLHLNHRMQATIYALKNGLISLDEITTEGDNF